MADACGGFGSVLFQGNEAVKKYTVGGPTTYFLRETTALKSLRHPNIVQFLRASLSHNDDATVVTLRFDDTLRAFKGAPPSSRVLASICRQLTRAVAHMHTTGFMHRDIKPANVLVRRARSAHPHVALCDFNTAIRIVAGRCNTRDVTTVPYAAPEMLLGCDTYDEAVDAWGVGVTMLEVALGHFPFTSMRPDMKSEDMAQCVFEYFAVPDEMHEYPRCTAALREQCGRQADLSSKCTYAPVRKFLARALVASPRNRACLSKVRMLPFRTGTTSDAKWNGNALHKRHREILFEWLAEVATKFKLANATYLRTLALIDAAVLREFCVSPAFLQLTACACLSLVAIEVERCAPEDSDYVYISDSAFTLDELVACKSTLVRAFACCVDVPISKALSREASNLLAKWAPAKRRADAEQVAPAETSVL